MVYNRVKKNVPAELDMLDSPLLSPTPLGSAVMLGSVPGSALAERIFNDPSAWETVADPDSAAGFQGAAGGDPMAWFIEEVEKFKLNSGSSTGSSAQSSAASTVDGGMLKRDLLMDLGRHRNIRPISLVSLFDHGPYTKEKDSASDIFSPASTEDSMSDVSSAPVDITDFISPASAVAVPAPIYSASTTLSFLDLYLESPSKNAMMRKSLARYPSRSMAARPRSPLIQISTEQLEGQGRPVSLFSPLAGHPDMSVEPLKRGSSVPPLAQIQLPIPMIPSTVDENRDVRTPPPSMPPGLSQTPPPPPPPSTEEVQAPPRPPPASVSSLPSTSSTPSRIAATTASTTTASLSSSSSSSPAAARKAAKPAAVLPSTPPRNKRGSPPRSLPKPVLPPPPYTSTTTAPSREASSSPPNALAKVPLPSAIAATPSTSSSSQASTPIRRLPSIPPALQSSSTGGVSTPMTGTSTSTPARTASPLPSAAAASALLSPEPSPYNHGGSGSYRPLSGVRSPLGGPVGPRTRASAVARAVVERKTPSPSGGVKRQQQGQGQVVGMRRPPVLHL